MLSSYLPHIDQLLGALRINHDRLNGRSKIAVDVRLLKALLQALVARTPFDADFYLKTYPDVAEAHARGDIPDLQQHFVETGFFEGRFGAPPSVDDAFYTSVYADVAAAIERGTIASAAEHYLASGAAEGRLPNAAIKPEVDYWASILRDDSRRA